MTEFQGLHKVCTREEVADMLRVHERTVDRLIAAGKLEAFHVGSQVRISRDAVQRYVESMQMRGAVSADTN